MKHLNLFLVTLTFAYFGVQAQEGTKFICGDLPVNHQILNQYPMLKSRSSNTPQVIKIYIHIVANSDGSNGFETTNLDSVRLKFELMQQLYSAHGICFLLAGIGQINNSDLDHHLVDTEEAELQAYLKPGMFNIFIHDFLGFSGGGSAGGWAYAIPNPGLYFSVWELAIIDANAMPVFAHELGHCLGLFHTHDTGAGAENVDRSGACKNCENTGDLLCDTPADPKLDIPGLMSNCTYVGNVTDNCGVLYLPDPQNVMSYSGGTCQTKFTLGQGIRMLSFLTAPPFNTTLAPENITFSTTGSWTSGEHFYLASQNVVLNSTDLSVVNAAMVTFGAGDAVTVFPGTTFSPQTGYVHLTAREVCDP